MKAAGGESGESFNYLRRLARLREALSAAEIEALLVSSPENVSYLSGFRESYIKGFHKCSAALLITREEQILFSDFRFRLQAAQQAPNFRFQEVERKPFLGAAQFAKERGVESGAFEADFLSAEELTRLRRAARGVHWRRARGLVESLRAIKEKEEIIEIVRAAEIGDRTFLHILSLLAPGKTEREIATQGVILMLEAGAKGAAFGIIIASGPNGALPHAEPGRRALRKGDLVVIDLGVELASGYCSDLTRTVAIGPARRWQKEIYSLVYEAQAKGLAALRAGAPAQKVDAAARAHIAAAGYGEYFGHGLGHAVGLAAHEEPRLSRRASRPLAAGMVVTVEPGVYLPGRGGVRIEDLALVTDKGCRLLSHAPKPMELMEI